MKFKLLEFNEKSINNYFDLLKKDMIEWEKNFDDFSEPVESWEQLKEVLTNQLVALDSDFDAWDYNQDTDAMKEVISALLTVDDYLDMMIDINSPSVLLDVKYELQDEDYYQERLEEQMESYHWLDQFYGHGFVFGDGSTLDISFGNDHRTIDIDRWYKDRIITLSLNDGILTVRFNDNASGNQIRAIEEIVEDNSVQEIYYDVYNENSRVNSGSIDTSYGQFDLWGIL